MQLLLPLASPPPPTSAFRDFDNELVYFFNFQNHIVSRLARSLLLLSLSCLSVILSCHLTPCSEKRVRSHEKGFRSLKKGVQSLKKRLRSLTRRFRTHKKKIDPLRNGFDPLRKGLEPLRRRDTSLVLSHGFHQITRNWSLAIFSLCLLSPPLVGLPFRRIPRPLLYPLFTCSQKY